MLQDPSPNNLCYLHALCSPSLLLFHITTVRTIKFWFISVLGFITYKMAFMYVRIMYFFFYCYWREPLRILDSFLPLFLPFLFFPSFFLWLFLFRESHLQVCAYSELVFLSSSNSSSFKTILKHKSG